MTPCPEAESAPRSVVHPAPSSELGGAPTAFASRPGEAVFRAFGAFGPHAHSGRAQASASLGNRRCAKPQSAQPPAVEG
eukprot:1987588-Alexandrium_andersonii.AAC.1